MPAKEATIIAKTSLFLANSAELMSCKVSSARSSNIGDVVKSKVEIPRARERSQLQQFQNAGKSGLWYTGCREEQRGDAAGQAWLLKTRDKLVTLLASQIEQREFKGGEAAACEEHLSRQQVSAFTLLLLLSLAEGSPTRGQDELAVASQPPTRVTRDVAW